MMRNNPGPPALLLTRPRADAEQMARQFAPVARVVVSPLVEIVPTGAAPDLRGYAGVIYTSRNAVRLSPDPAGLPAYVVGPRSAELARERGAELRLVAPDAEALVAALAEHVITGNLLHLRGEHGRGAVAERLCSAGIETHQAVLYRQVLRDLSPEARALLDGERPVIVPLFSPRTAAHFATVARPRAELHVVCLSRAVAEALGDLPRAALEVAATPDGEAMERAIRACVSRLASLEGGGTAQ